MARPGGGIISMKKIFFLLCFLVTGAYAQDTHRFYNQKGKAVAFDKMVKELGTYDVVLFGELHNNALVHWLQLQTLKAMHASAGDRLLLGAEMFERDNQAAISAYLDGSIDAKKLGTEARLWPNHKTDYAPLLDYAKQEKIPFYATNVPRRFASTIARKGMDSLVLNEEEKHWSVKLPFEVSLETPGYEEMVKMVHSGGNAMNFVGAQAIKDATMAESILNHWASGKVFLHFHGDFHSKNFGGIYWYLKKARPDLKIAVLAVEEKENVKDKPSTAAGNFTLVIPPDMAKSY